MGYKHSPSIARGASTAFPLAGRRTLQDFSAARISWAWPSTFTLGKTFRIFPFGINEVSGAHDSHRLLAVKVLLLPHSVSFQHGVGSIARQGKVQLVLVTKLLQLFHGIAAYTQNPCPELVQFFFGVTELVRLARSTGRVGFGEKEKDESLALESVQRNLVPGVGR